MEDSPLADEIASLGEKMAEGWKQWREQKKNLKIG
jgi:hypothetical protein